MFLDMTCNLKNKHTCKFFRHLKVRELVTQNTLYIESKHVNFIRNNTNPVMDKNLHPKAYEDEFWYGLQIFTCITP